jgi:hypothetical protein
MLAPVVSVMLAVETCVKPAGCKVLLRNKYRRAARALDNHAGSIAWHPPPRCPSLPAMKPDREDNECWTSEQLSFAQVRAELLAVVMRTHPEFSLEQAQEMLREVGL